MVCRRRFNANRYKLVDDMHTEQIACLCIFSSESLANYILVMGSFTVLYFGCVPHLGLICCVNIQNAFLDKRACWVKVGEQTLK